MIKPFKLLKGYTYSDEYTFPIARRMSGRTIAQDLSNQVQQMVRSPEYIPAGYVSIPLPQTFYDEYVITLVRTKMRQNINWRGYETSMRETRDVTIRRAGVTQDTFTSYTIIHYDNVDEVNTRGLIFANEDRIIVKYRTD